MSDRNMHPNNIKEKTLNEANEAFPFFKRFNITDDFSGYNPALVMACLNDIAKRHDAVVNVLDDDNFSIRFRYKSAGWLSSGRSEVDTENDSGRRFCFVVGFIKDESSRLYPLFREFNFHDDFPEYDAAFVMACVDFIRDSGEVEVCDLTELGFSALFKQVACGWI